MRYAIIHMSIKTLNGTIFRSINVNIKLYEDAVKMIHKEYAGNGEKKHFTSSLKSRKTMGPLRFELRTSAMSRRRHSQLDHEPACIDRELNPGYRLGRPKSYH